MKPNANTPKINKAMSLAGLLLAAILPVSQAHANLVNNGSFEDAYVGFATSYYHPPSGILGNSAQYSINGNPKVSHGGFASIAPQDGSLMFVANGAENQATVWSQSGISVAAHTNYDFSAWLTTLGEGDALDFEFRINGVKVGSTFSTGTAVGWNQFNTTWNSGNSTSVTLSIVDLSTGFGGNDFALDNIAFDQAAASAVPEPASLALVAVGLSGALFSRRRRQAGR